MPRIFQRLVKGGRRNGFFGEPRVTVAAFGKHPGWDDHMPGIGLETAVLADLKQSFYVGGIGGEIDAGSWERLEPEKRLEGFDHTFIWLRDLDVVLGQFWSSTDGRGRTKYPMVVCVHGQGLAPGVLLETPRSVLTRLRSACQQTQSAEEVQRACQAAQAEMADWLAGATSDTIQLTPGLAEKRQFLEHVQLGPDRLGLARIFHELENAIGRSSSGPLVSGPSDVRPYHVRVPLCAGSAEQSLVLWSELINTVIPSTAPVLLLVRRGSSWLDLVIGSVDSDDLFCLQASPKALPLATEVPYDLAPDLAPRLRQVEAEFLGAEATPAPPLPPPAEPELRPSTEALPRTPVEEGRSIKVGRALLGTIAGVVVLGGAAWLVPRLIPPTPTTTSTTPASSTTTAPPVTQSPKPPDAYSESLAAARVLLQQSNWTAAQQQARLALAQKPDDQAAATLLAEIQNRLDAAATAASNAAAIAASTQTGLRELEAFKTAGRDALEKRDWAAASQAWKGASRVAERLGDDRRRQEAGKELQYVQALADADGLLRQANWDGAHQQVQLALTQKPNDSLAQTLLAQVEQGRQAAAQNAALEQQRREFETLRASAVEALRKRDWTAAGKAWKDLIGRAEAMKDEAQRQAATKELEYVQAASEAERLLKAGNWDGAQKQAELALGHIPGDEFLTGLLTQVQKGRQAAAQNLADENSRRELQNFRTVARAAAQKHDWITATNALQASLQIADRLKDETQRQELGKELRYASAAAQAEAHLKQGQWDKAQEQAQLALAEMPADPLATSLLAQVREQRHAASLKAQEEKNRRDAEAVEAARQEAIRKRLDEGRASEAAPTPVADPVSVGKTDYDDVLAVLEVRFGLRKEDPTIVERGDRRPAQPLPAHEPLNRAELDRKLRFLKEQFGKKGVPPDRMTRLKAVEDAIRNWK